MPRHQPKRGWFRKARRRYYRGTRVLNWAVIGFIVGSCTTSAHTVAPGMETLIFMLVLGIFWAILMVIAAFLKSMGNPNPTRTGLISLRTQPAEFILFWIMIATVVALKFFGDTGLITVLISAVPLSMLIFPKFWRTPTRSVEATH